MTNAADILTANGFTTFSIYATGSDWIDALISAKDLDEWSRRTAHRLNIPEDGDCYPEPTIDGGIVFSVR